MKLILLVLILQPKEGQQPIKNAEFNYFETKQDVRQLVAKINAELAYPMGAQKFKLEKPSATLYMDEKRDQGNDPAGFCCEKHKPPKERKDGCKYTGNCQKCKNHVDNLLGGTCPDHAHEKPPEFVYCIECSRIEMACPVCGVKAKRVRKVMLKSNLGEYSEKDQILQFTGNCEIKVEDGPTFTSDQAAMDIKQFDIELSGNVTASNIQPGSQVQITSGHFKLFLKKTGQQNNPYQLEQFKAHTRVVVKDPQGFTIEADNLDYQLGVTHLTSEKSVTIVQQGNMINCKNAVLEGTVLDCIDQVNAKFDQNNVAADRMRLFLEDRDGKAELKRAVISNAKITGQGTFLKAPLVIKEGEELWVKGPKLLVIKTKDAKSYATCEGDMRITPAQVELFKKCELSSPDSTIFADKIVITLKDGNLSKLVMIDRPIIVSADGTTLAPAVAVFEEDILKCTGRPMVYITGTGFTMQANVTTLDSKTGRFTANRTTNRTQIKVSMK